MNIKGFPKLSNFFFVIFVLLLISILTIRLYMPEMINDASQTIKTSRKSVHIQHDDSNKNSLNNDLVRTFERSVLKQRNDLGNLAELLGYETCIEIGVRTARFALILMQNWPSMKAYYGIDPYLQQKNYIDLSNSNNETQNEIYLKSKAELEEIAKKRKILTVQLIRKFSSDAVNLFEDESIDFIYIDARHDYCAVTEDLEAYYPKVKCNGMLAGHDFMNTHPDNDWGICANGSRVLIKGGGVKGAVLDFIERKGIKNLKLTREAGPSYYFIKKC